MQSLLTRRKFVSQAAALSLLGAPRRALAQSVGSGAGLLARLRAAKSVTVGLANFPPYSGVDPDGALNGVVPELGKAIMTRLGVPELHAIVASYGQLIPGMQAGRWDFICTAMTISKVRCTQVLFSDPIIFDGGAFVSLKGSLRPPPKRVSEIVARNLVVGVSAGGAIARICQMAGVSLGNLKQFGSDVAMVDALAAKRVDVVFQDRASVMLVVTRRGLPVDVAYPIPDSPEHGSSCAFRPADTDLYDAFQKELRAMKASGEYLSIARKYGFDTPANLIKITAREACAGAT